MKEDERSRVADPKQAFTIFGSRPKQHQNLRATGTMQINITQQDLDPSHVKFEDR